MSRRVGLLPRLSSCAGGNVAMTFALAAVPMLLIMGAAVDYTRAVTKRTALQQAVDAAALAVVHDLAQNYTDAAVAADATSYFAAAVNDSKAYLSGGPTISTDRSQVCLTAKNPVPTMLMPIGTAAGVTPMTTVLVSATGCAQIGSGRFEIALALDNSGSMNESTGGTTKIASLQSAAKQLVGIMDPAGAATVRSSFSVVPFSSAVNVGAGRAGAAWLDTAGQSSIHWQNFQLPAAKYNVWVPTSKFDLFSYVGTPWAGCVEERPAPYTSTDTPAQASQPDTLFVPYLYPDEGTSLLPAYLGLQPMNDYLSKSAGYCSTLVQPGAVTYTLADAPANVIAVRNVVANTLRSDGQTMVCKYRGQSVSSANSAFSDVNGSRLRAGPNLLCSSKPVTTLTSDTTAVTAALDAMTPNGDTNLVGGFMWAWRTISPNGPFGGQPVVTVGPQNPVNYGTASVTKVIILMTDGFNHWSSLGGSINGNAYSSFGYYQNGRLGPTSASNYRDLMDAATLQACNNAKQVGVTVYTVGFSIPSNPIDSQGITLLQNCATGTNMAFVAQDGTALLTAFTTIANQLSGLRLSH